MKPALPALLLAALALASSSAHASEAEAKDVARNANCPPGKVEVLKRTQGGNAETIYKIACSGQKDVFVAVRCVGRLCVLLR
ncbi:hypothetical protein [Indioceanicola profundi]|uniref:hypothetical protein n=1 Tax=Indioceanicola profundi TaxID=2220096 RepID=UPI000E6AD823|nr:hypothetical protein [Indioceanicola profundi]